MGMSFQLPIQIFLKREVHMKSAKKLAFMLAMFMVVSAVASCGSGDRSESSLDSSSVESSDATEESTDESSDVSDEFSISDDLDGHLTNTIASSQNDGKANGKNIIMIQLNSISNSIMNADSGSVTPFLNGLKDEGIYFSNFYNQATDRGDIEYSVFNSLLSPLAYSIEDKSGVKFNSLANVLKNNGYASLAFTGNDDRFASADDMLSRYGFDEVNTLDGSDNAIYSAALKEIKSSNGKSFYFISNIDSLYPYIPSEYSEQSVTNAGLLTGYANAAAKADTALKAFIEGLKSAGLYDDSLIVIYGSSPMLDYTYDEIDKSCATFLNGGFNAATAHNVPLMIIGLENSEYTDLATVYDVYPTLVALTGASYENILIYGENLFSEADRSEKIFPVQDSLCRGSHISNKIYYMRFSKSSAECYDRVTGEKYKIADYKAGDTLCKHIANESEYVVTYNYFSKIGKYGEVSSLTSMYDAVPSTGKLTLVKEGTEPIEAKTALMSYHTQFYYAYDCTGGLYGTKIYGRQMILDDGKKEGMYISSAIDAGSFEVLYTGWDITYNGGSAEIYVSVADGNGISSSWLQIATITENVLNCTPYEDDMVKVTSSRVYMKNGASNGKVRIKIKLIASADGKSPELDYFTFTTDSVKVFDSNYADNVKIEKSELKVSRVSATSAEKSGVAGVACLVSSTTGLEPDITGTTSKIFDEASGSYNNLAAICEYIHSLGIDSFIDYLDAEGVARVFEKNQQVLCYNDETQTFYIIYGFEGKKKAETYYVYDILTGKTKKISVDEFASSWNGYAVIMNTYVENIVPKTEINGVSSIMAEGSQDRPGTIAEKTCIIIHNTGNYSSGSGAANHALYKLNHDAVWTSWHFTVDNNEIYQHLPTDEVAWHASDGAEGQGNKNGIGIEICVNGFPASDGSGAVSSDYWGAEYEAWEKQFKLAYENAAQLVAQLLIEHDIGLDSIFQHYDMAPNKKNCPMQMRYSFATGTFVHDGDLWLDFLTMVEIRYNRLLATGDKFDTVNVD